MLFAKNGRALSYALLYSLKITPLALYQQLKWDLILIMLSIMYLLTQEKVDMEVLLCYRAGVIKIENLPDNNSGLLI